MGALYQLAIHERIQQPSRKPAGRLTHTLPESLVKYIDGLITLPSTGSRVIIAPYPLRTRVEAARRLCREMNAQGLEPLAYNYKTRHWEFNGISLAVYQRTIEKNFEHYLAICKELEERRTFD